MNGSVVDTYSYSYDNLGNITIVSRNNGQPIYYTYDAQNQLIEVNDGTFRYEYTYDTYGNILSVGWFDAITDDEISIDTYAYGNSQWVDRLTEFNGEEFDYDQIGNPLSYYNGYSYTFTWNGRELATATKGSTSVSYKYGADGLRTQKTVGNTVYNYYYADGLLIRQTWGTNYMDFLYDESGSPYSFIYNGTQYYYIKNLQGDVMRIVDATGSVVANYTYDAWGKVTNSGNIIGLYNPIRYRGYYYDTETGFYYLQSRYYDPTIKRFINADSSINANGDLLGFNMYAYCGNNIAQYSLGMSISAPIINSSSGYSSKSGNKSNSNASGTNVSSIAFANVVLMTNHSTTLVDDILFGMVLGNISHTTTTQHNDAGTFYIYSNIGNSTSSVGIGFNIKNWYGQSRYISTNLGIGSSTQITPYATFGSEISVLDGVSFSWGPISGDVTNETTVNIGWGTLTLAYAVCTGIAALPIPGARAVAGATAGIIVLIDVLR